MLRIARLAVMLALGLAAVASGPGCGGGDGGSPPADAPAPPDVAARACDGRAYDPCTDTANSSDCMAGLQCRLFMSQGFTICTPSCDANTPCPADESGNVVACNSMGRCRSNAPNTCTR